MNAEQLLTHYERIADAPDAVAKLRRLVLDLAVRGKLIEQDASDGSASDALSKIPATGVGKQTKGRLAASRSTPVGNVPFAIPSSWEWVRFSTIADFSAGRTPPRHDSSFWNTGDYPWVSIADMVDGELLTATKETVSEVAKEHVFRAGPALPGTMIMSFKLTIGKIARLAVSAYHNEAIISIKPKLPEFDPYLFKVLPSFARQGNTKGAIKGATLNRESISNILIPLPPIAEQRRVVEKVDELMALCDQLEVARADREATRDRLAAASLARLNAPDAETFPADARFALDALPSLTDRADQVKQLRQTILNLAVRGKLVQQSHEDGSAAELLEKVSAERQQLIARKLLRQERPLSPIEEKEPPFRIPESWCWSRIGNAVLFTQYGTSEKAYPVSIGVPVLAMGNIQEGKVVWANEKRISDTSNELPGLYLKKYDLLYNRTNSAELVGKTGIYLGDDDELTFASYLIRLRPSIRWMNPRYLNAWMNTSLFRSTQIVPLIKKQTGQANVNGTALKNMLVPLPPLAEQHRIVAKVDELMAICDQLEASLTNADTTRRRLLDALLAEALQPALQAAA